MINKIKLFLGLAEAKQTFVFVIYEMHNEPKSKLFTICSFPLYRTYYFKDIINNSKISHIIKFSI